MPFLKVAARWPGRTEYAAIDESTRRGACVSSLEAVWVQPYDHPGAAVVTGVFDILHVGHVRYLGAVAARGLPLVVGVEDDPRVRAWKGPSAAVQPGRRSAPR